MTKKSINNKKKIKNILNKKKTFRKNTSIGGKWPHSSSGRGVGKLPTRKDPMEEELGESACNIM